ncbi:MAG: magnesium-translocating P-type ATPase [Candidatus Micrarchaeota archaeon]|nr:magnesium-translocating P-type ATPase [Candidatus Micrarchaeota archaeon]
MGNNNHGKYWKMGVEEVAASLKTDIEKGLSSHEAAHRRRVYGKNVIPEKDRRGILELLLSQFNNAFMLILLVASAISIYFGDTTEALTIIAVLVASALLGFYQEYKSENALLKLKKYLTREATVIRDGRELRISAEDLVPGDIVLLNIGDIVPADVRITKCEDFVADESAITGESKGVLKSATPINKAAPEPYELTNYALMGTTVAYGTAHGVVVATGEETHFGKTATLYTAKVPESEFQKSIREFSVLMLRVIAVMVAVVFGINALVGRGMLDSLMFALALAVGIAPEMLPAITTISLSSGALKMAEKKAVVKKLAVIEDIGQMDVLLMDKTGTLTEPDLVLEKAVSAGNNGNERTVLNYALLCSHAASRGRHVSGNVYDVAILRHANALGIKKDTAYKPIDDIGFDYTRKRVSEVFAHNGRHMLITKGEAGSVVSVCSHVRVRGGLQPIRDLQPQIQKDIVVFTREGYSVLAVASREVQKKDSYSVADEDGLTLEGYLLFKGIPKKTAPASIHELKSLGVSLMLLTGDDPYVAERLCKDVGLEVKGGRVVTGKEVDAMDEGALRKAVEEHNIFARVTPTQKVRILEAVRANGHIVGFMGDGVNDAPALRLADVGISVDTAQDIAKESADVVLTHKSLRVIADGVKEGRKTFGNITKYILNTISANFGNTTTMVVSPLLLPFLPLLPVQILLNNLLSDFPLLTISTDNVDERFIQKPRKWSMKMIQKFMMFFGAVSTMFDLITLLVFYWVFGLSAVLVRTLWFLESLLSEVFITFIVRTRGPSFKSVPSKLLVAASLFTVTAAVAIVSVPVLGQWFEFEAPGPENIALVFGIVLAYCVTTELVKHWFFSRHKEFEDSY